MREATAEFTNRILHLREVNVRLEARIKQIVDGLGSKVGEHDELVRKLREDRKTDQSNWPFRSIEDAGLKTSAATVIEKLAGELRAACIESDRDRMMFDWLASRLGEASFETDGGDVDPTDYMDEGVTVAQAWRHAISKHLEGKTNEPDGKA